MDQNTLKHYLTSKKGVTQEFPFGPDVAVFKLLGKMYALLAWPKSPMEINLKCDPDQALVLREAHPAIKPGYHMNKQHWNTVVLDNSLPQAMIFEMIDDSYDLIAKSLKKAERERLAQMLNEDAKAGD